MSFIEIHPVPFKKEMVINFETMETDVVTIDLKPFAISKYPVTNEEFQKFIQTIHYLPENRFECSSEAFLAHWKNGREPPGGKDHHPVVFVSYDDAIAYTEFIGGRLPTYQEWLYAAYGGTVFNYPWGDVFSPELCNVRESKIMDTTPVGHYSLKGDSPVGCCDIVGNVWQWTSTPFGDEEDMFVAVGTGWDHYSFQTEILLDRSYRNRSVGFKTV